MLTILHGEDITASRNYYHELKQAASQPITFEGDKVSLTDLTQAISGGGLFVEKQDIYLENFLSKKKDIKELAAISTLLTDNAKTHNIVLWEGKELTKKQSETLKGASSKIFKLPQALFSFLESIKPLNTRQMLTLYHQTLVSSEPEMIFFMLTKQFRILLALKDRGSEIDEVRRIAPWQKSKLQNQASAFSSKQLIKLYKSLAKLDIEHKTGGNAVPLSSSIDFFLLGV